MMMYRAALAACIFMIIHAVPGSLPEDTHGQTHHISGEAPGDDGAGMHESEQPFMLFIPPKMIAGGAYEGMIMKKSPDYATSVSLASQGAEMTIPRNVTIEDGKNHAIFEIRPKGAGDVIVFAIGPDGNTHEVTSQIHTIAEIATGLEITTPMKNLNTETPLIPIFITLVDDHGIPVTAGADIPFTLTSTADSATFSTAGAYTERYHGTIKDGDYHARVQAMIAGDGDIMVTSNKLESDSVPVQYTDDNITVNVAVAPEMAASDSVAWYYVWLERGGLTYVPDKVLDVYLVSGNEDHAVFLHNHGNQDSGKIHTVMVDGIARGPVYTRAPTDDAGPLFITALVPGFGSAEAEVSITKPEPLGSASNSTRIWVYPPHPTDRAWAIVGWYQENPERGTVPVLLSEPRVVLSTGAGIRYGYAHDTNYQGTGETFSSSTSTEIPLQISSISSHQVTAHTDSAKPVTASFESRPRAGHEAVIEINPIPAIRGIHGPIAFATISDNGVMVDPTATDSRWDARVITTGDAILDVKLERLEDAAFVVHGMHVRDGGNIQVQIPGISSKPENVPVSGIITGAELWIPAHVNTGDEFPVTLHAVDANGAPISRHYNIDEFTVSSDTISVISGPHTRLVSNHDGDHRVSIITDGQHIGTGQFRSFSNNMGGEVTVRHSDRVRLGSDIFLDVRTGSIPNPTTTVEGLGFVYHGGGSYVASPEGPGTYEITVTVEGEGWETYREKFEVIVEELVDVSYAVATDDGVEIPTALTLVSLQDMEYRFISGVRHTLHPGIHEVSTDTRYDAGSDRIYQMQDLRINDVAIGFADKMTLNIDGNAHITAAYNRVINVDIVASGADVKVDGSGQYRYDEIVMLKAHAVPVMFGIIWNYPSSWSGLPEDAVVEKKMLSSEARFRAADSVTLVIDYTPSYAVIIGIIGVVCVVPVVILWRSPDAFMNLKDGVRACTKRMKTVSIPRSTK